MVKIGIDPGHGGADAGACGMGYREKDIALDVALKLRDRLAAAGVEVVMSRDGDWKYYLDQGADLTRRAQVFNEAGCDAVISLHLNSAMQPAWGVETYTWDGNSVANAFGDAVHSAVKHLGSVDRGRKWANFAIVRETDAVACLVEMSFINSDDVYNVAGKEDTWADALCKGICGYFGLAAKPAPAPQPQQPSSDTIIAPASATVDQGRAWAKVKGAAAWFIDQAQTYWDVATKAGVNPAGVYAQSAIETGFGKFGGAIDETYKNPCGLKRTEGGGNYDPGAHMRFTDWQEGITAQVHHLLLYAGQPQNPTPDPRHFAWLSGKAKTWQALGGNWAPSPAYGDKIVALMREIESMPAAKPAKVKVPEWALDDYKKIMQNGFLDGTRLFDAPTRLEAGIIGQRVYDKMIAKVEEMLKEYHKR
ncbi:N-acetylmuramoyl-L-alanine amidase [Peptococcus simiae]|uniref:N-acetylmuramoyl-L-alanine amidase n=1 Tax=Peptococcus simiae TaxID=1643805 RepID=UPI0039809D0B